MNFKGKNYYAVILGASSGFGLATAKKLAKEGMNIVAIHRDFKSSMSEINKHFDEIRSNGVNLITYNANALSNETQDEIITELVETFSINKAKVRLLLHSIALGKLKLLTKTKKNDRRENKLLKLKNQISEKLGISSDELSQIITDMFEQGHYELYPIANSPEYDTNAFITETDIQNTIYAMGYSLLTWVNKLFNAGLFACDSRVVSLTSEGNSIAWKGYAAVSAAKAVLESILRSIAIEFAPYGIRANAIQAGVTITPALKKIPGNSHITAKAALRNPFGRLTRPEDVANVISLLCTREASWINGEIIRVDGG